MRDKALRDLELTTNPRYVIIEVGQMKHNKQTHGVTHMTDPTSVMNACQKELKMFLDSRESLSYFEDPAYINDLEEELNDGDDLCEYYVKCYGEVVNDYKDSLYLLKMAVDKMCKKYGVDN